MTVASYTSDLTDIFLFQTTTGVSAYGGGGAGLGTGADFAMEGTLAVDKQITAAEKGLMYDNVTNFTIGADDHFFIWVMLATPGLADTRNNRGIVGCIGDDTANFVKFHLDGSDSLPLGGGKVHALRFLNTTLANFRTLVGAPGTTPSWIGGGANTTASVKGANLGVDGARIGTGYDILNGTGADPEANFAGIATDDEGTSEGIFQSVDGGYALQGKLRIGSAATACEFLDSNVLVVIKDTRHSLTDFTEILLEHASSILTLSRVTFSTLGTNNLGRFEILTSAAVAALTSCTFQNFGVTILGTGSVFTECLWLGSGIVTANGADLEGSSISGFEGTVDTSPLIWDVATDPDGKLDNMTFVKGSAATHAVEFGTTSPLTMTLRGWVVSGYNASDAQNDSTFHVLRTTGTVTINVIGGTGNFSYKSAGATVNIILDPVTTLVTVRDDTGADLQNARVRVEAGDGTGDLPFDVTVTITHVTTVATVTHTAHGMASGDKVVIRKADQSAYNGVFSITVTGVNTYTYTMGSDPGVDATGTVKATGIVLEGLTDINGEISASAAYSVDQNVKIAIRKSTASPLYKAIDATDVIDNVNGLTVTRQMVSDE